MKTISPQELYHHHQKGPVSLLDVRTALEHSEMHVPGVKLVPLDQLEAAHVAEMPKDAPVYILCRSGARAQKAATKLEAAGYSECHVVEGGTLAWAAAGLPLNRSGQPVMSLERQVRIAAGFLVLTGVLLGFFVNPGFFGLAGFVGAGLIFAGATDWCGMGLLLAKMPWNNKGCGT
jgi:rhodanese-related sulfurtransferase